MIVSLTNRRLQASYPSYPNSSPHAARVAGLSASEAAEIHQSLTLLPGQAASLFGPGPMGVLTLPATHRFAMAAVVHDVVYCFPASDDALDLADEMLIATAGFILGPFVRIALAASSAHHLAWTSAPLINPDDKWEPGSYPSTATITALSTGIFPAAGPAAVRAHLFPTLPSRFNPLLKDLNAS